MMPAWRVLLLLVLIGTLAWGCGPRKPRQQVPQVTPLAMADVLALEADDIVIMMRRAGFSDQEVLMLGPYIRNALAQSGGAQVRLGGRVEAIFAADGTSVHVSSRRTGSFIHRAAAE